MYGDIVGWTGHFITQLSLFSPQLTKKFSVLAYHSFAIFNDTTTSLYKEVLALFYSINFLIKWVKIKKYDNKLCKKL